MTEQDFDTFIKDFIEVSDFLEDFRKLSDARMFIAQNSKGPNQADAKLSAETSAAFICTGIFKGFLLVATGEVPLEEFKEYVSNEFKNLKADPI